MHSRKDSTFIKDMLMMKAEQDINIRKCIYSLVQVQITTRRKLECLLELQPAMTTCQMSQKIF